MRFCVTVPCHFIKKSIDPNTLKALITGSGGEVISFEALDPNPGR